jgi:hypothetical protein
MKKIILAVTLLTLALSFTTAQERGSIKRVQVKAETLASQPAGEPYVIDLTRKGAVHEVAEGIDYSRVRVRTSTGEMALSDLARQTGRTGKLLVGTFSDLSAVGYGFPPGTSEPPDRDPSEASCNKSAGVCTCTGKKDCNDLGKSGKCMKGGSACGKAGANHPVKGASGKWGCDCLAKEA